MGAQACVCRVIIRSHWCMFVAGPHSKCNLGRRCRRWLSCQPVLEPRGSAGHWSHHRLRQHTWLCLLDAVPGEKHKAEGHLRCPQLARHPRLARRTGSGYFFCYCLRGALSSLTGLWYRWFPGGMHVTLQIPSNAFKSFRLCSTQVSGM